MTMRLGLTTTPDRIRTLAQDVELFGLVPVSLPCIRIDAKPSSLDKLDAAVRSADLLLVTSVRAVELLAPAGLPSLPIIAVGSKTAKAVETAGGSIKWVGSDGVRELACEAAHLLTGRRIVVAGASNTARRNAAALEAVGSSVVSVPLYTTVPVPPAGDHVDAVLFGSPTAVAGWLMSRGLSDLVIGAIGPTTASALRERGFDPDVVPEQPGFTETIERLAALRPERIVP